MERNYPRNIALAYIPRRAKLLLNKRIDGPYKGLWSFVGGHLEMGETIEECIEREIKEETSLDAKFVALRGIASEILYEGSRVESHFIMWVCEVKIQGGEAKEMAEGEVRWFSREEVERVKDEIVAADYVMLHNFIFKDKSRLPLHKIHVHRKGKRFEVEYFGL